MRTLSLIAATLAMVGASSSVPAQTPRAEVLILGTPHLGSTGDYLGGSGIDVLQESRQREVEEIVRLLAEFRPTKIAVEVPVELDTLLHARYLAYRAGTREPARSETEQIGFRLAKEMGHARLYPIDFELNEELPRVVQWAAQNGDTGFVRLVEEFGKRMAAEREAQQAMSLLEVIRSSNTPEYDALHSGYLRMAQVGSDAGHVGASVVADRYERNLKIFANLARIVEPGDRVLVIYGASHGKLLRDFVRESGDFELVHPDRYLGGAGGPAR